MNSKIPTVGTVIFNRDKVLLIIKKNHPKSAYQLPGGQIEPHENPAEAASRELKETTNLHADPEKLIRIPKQWQAKIKKDYGEAVFTFTCFICVDHTGEIQETDVATPKWIALDTLDQLLLNPNTENAINAARQILAR